MRRIAIAMTMIVAMTMGTMMRERERGKKERGMREMKRTRREKMRAIKRRLVTRIAAMPTCLWLGKETEREKERMEVSQEEGRSSLRRLR
jgi:hypothetical protein